MTGNVPPPPLSVRTGSANKIRIGISACLLGHPVRYNGELKRSAHIVERFGSDFDLVPVCPEVEFGLPIPREPMHLQGDPANPRMIITSRSEDITKAFRRWVAQRTAQLQEQDLCGYIFKTRSPSCGMRSVPVLVNTHRWAQQGVGLFAAALLHRLPFLPTEDEERLQAGDLEVSFRDRVVRYHRWLQLTAR